MKKYLILSLLLLEACHRGPTEKPLGEIMLCGDQTLLIVDGDASQGYKIKELWRWEVSGAADQIPAEMLPHFSNLDECKFVDEGRKILITCGAGGVALIDRASRDLLFSAVCPMSHSADLLPGGRIAVALSTHPEGNSIEVYDLREPGRVLWRDSLYSGHGSVWLEKRQRYYALGFDELREYSLRDWDGPNPQLQRERSWTLPAEGGHELSAASNDLLLVSDHEGVSMLDLESGVFAPQDSLVRTPHVKSVSYDPVSGQTVYTKAEEEWWTYNVHCLSPDKTITVPWIKIYKARTHPRHLGATME